MARKMRTREEIIRKVPIFQTKAWGNRAEAIKNRIEKQRDKNRKRKLK